MYSTYLNEGHCSTDKHFWMLIIMYTNGYNSIPVMAGLKIRKKNKKKIKEFDSFDYKYKKQWLALEANHRLTHLHVSYHKCTTKMKFLFLFHS